jgi:hypothetical protein
VVFSNHKREEKKWHCTYEMKINDNLWTHKWFLLFT